ncbi:hypothetical protein UPYG_G00135150 [Umbra pygmaea]|uniref:LITAF domain-containing protein n=1 Tax=Umbra pygmaea TaxID=75934 RepID=A0ABD0XJ19_UMBPY
METEEHCPTECPEILSSDGSAAHLKPVEEQFEEQTECFSDDLPYKVYQGSPEPIDASSQLAFITSRRQHLHNRRLMLLKIKNFKDQNRALSSTVSFQEESDPSELEYIEQELFDLVEREEQLLQIANVSGAEVKHNHPSDGQNWSIYQGVCILPPSSLQGSVTSPCVSLGFDKFSSESNPDVIKNVEKLQKVPGIIQCPSCKKVVTTVTYRKIGEAAWTICFVSFMLGCVAGCCLIPFLSNKLKDVCHRCPECHKTIYTSERM